MRTMTLQVATRLRLHDDAPLTEPEERDAQTARRSRDSGELAAREVGPVDVGAGHSASIVWRDKLHRRLLAVGDIAAAAVALLATMANFDHSQFALSVLVGVAVVLLEFKVAGLYDRDDLRLVHSTLDEVPPLVQLTGLFSLVMALFQTVALNGTFGTGYIAALWAASFGAILAGRVVARAVAVRVAPAERCLVIGDSSHCDRIRRKLMASRVRALVVASVAFGEEVSDLDWVAMPDTIRRLVRQLNVDRIIVAPTTTDGSAVVNLIRTAKAVGVRVSVLPRLLEVVGTAVEFDDVDGMTMLGVRRFGLSRSSRLLKRGFDILVGGITLVALSPLLAVIALAILRDSGGPILFRQVRVGRDGKHFSMFKFRSMVADADARRDELKSLSEAAEDLFKLPDDPRVTRVGSLLRRTSLDELPQLLNVLRGEMSLVGPRPLVIDEDALVLGLDRSRLHLTPGMTGPWQILGYRVPMREMIGIDYLYVANWSLWLDLKVLFRTARHVARGANL
jgi:exopolysaccharide biosynthesis polyprenyl glycosylphosphotransferase